MRRFFMTTDAEIALASSSQRTMTRDKVERVSGTVHPEVEIPRPGAGEEMDVGEPTVVEDHQPVQLPVPTVRVGGSSNSGT